MRVLYHHRTMGRGAEGLHILHVVKALEDRGHSVDILSPPGIDPRKGAGASPVDMTEVKTTGTLSFWKNISKHMPQLVFELMEIGYNFWALPKLLWWHWQHKYDAIYERHAMFLIAGNWFSWLTGVPLVLEVNEVTGPKRARGQYLKAVTMGVEKRVFSASHTILTVSSFLADKVVERSANVDNVLVVPNCIDPADYAKDFHGPAIRNKYNISQYQVIGFAGWFSEWDRLDFFVDVFHELIEVGHDNVILMLVGDGPVMPGVREAISRYGIQDKVVLTGPVAREEVLDYLDAIDIAVIPASNDYGSPMVMFEFMALGKPVVAPDLRPMLDVIKHKENGLIFENLQRVDMVAKLDLILSDPELKSKIAASSKAMVYRNHTWEVVAQCVEERVCV